jgi:hypothetical protein
MSKSIFSKKIDKILNESITVDENMEDFSNDPVFVAKNEKAEKFLAEHGVPESFSNKTKAKNKKKHKA